MKSSFDLEMTEVEKGRVDDYMKDEFNANRSIVTDNKWQKTGPNCWVCAYAYLPKDKSCGPVLYIWFILLRIQIILQPGFIP